MKFTFLEWLKNALKLFTIVKENFEIYLPQMAKNALKLSTMMEKFLKFTYLGWLKMHLNYPPMVGENFEIAIVTCLN